MRKQNIISDNHLRDKWRRFRTLFHWVKRKKSGLRKHGEVNQVVIDVINNNIGHCFHNIWWLLKEPLFVLIENPVSLLAAGVFGHSFGSFTDSVFRQFAGQKQSDGGLDLAGADG